MKTNETFSLIMALSVQPKLIVTIMEECPGMSWGQVYDTLSELKKSGMVQPPSVGSYQYMLTGPGVAMKRELSIKEIVSKHLKKTLY